MGYPATPLGERFEKKYEPEPNSGCWLWTDHTDGDGYGIIWVGGGKRTKRAHRVSYELYKGAIPLDRMVCHRCDNRACVNPEHLCLGTNADNMSDMVRRGRSATVINPMPGEKNGRAKLTETAVRQIRELRSSGVGTKHIAAQYRIDRSTVQRIVRGEDWGHVQ